MQRDPPLLTRDVHERRVDDCQRLVHRGVAPRAGWGEGHAPRAAHEEGRAEVAFELRDPLGHRPAREVQHFGRALDIPVLRDGGKDPEGVQVRGRHRTIRRQFL